MSEYFSLQFRILNRKFSDFGVHPVVGYLLSCIGFIIIGILIFNKTDLAKYIFPLFIVPTLLQINNNKKRKDLLKCIFSDQEFIKIRIFENILLVAPFVVFLIYQLAYIPALLLLLFSIVIIWTLSYTDLQVTIRTPFSKWPYEYAIGLRKTWPLFLFNLFLTSMAISVGNFNLGIFTLAVVTFISLSFYGQPDRQIYIWIHAMSPKTFLSYKIKPVVAYHFILSLPTLILLLTFFFEHSFIIIGIFLLGYLYLITIILSRYLNHPQVPNLGQSILLGIGFAAPPLLLLLIPYFYIQSKKQLREILI